MMTSNQQTIVQEILDELRAIGEGEANLMLSDAPAPEKILAAINQVALNAAITNLSVLLDVAHEFEVILSFSKIMFGSEEEKARIVKRATLIKVLERNLTEARIDMPMGHFNRILTDLGYSLSESHKS